MIGIVASALVLSGVGFWWLFRRSSPVLSDEDLPDWAAAKNLHVERKLTEMDREEIKSAFLAGSDFQWLVSGKHEIENSSAEKEKHHRATFYMIECMISFAERYGHVIVCRDPTNNNAVLGVIGVIPPYPSRRRYSMHFLRSVVPLGKPVPKEMGKEASARFDAFCLISKEHELAMGNIPHWYVGLLGVSKAAQGKGVGRTLLQAAFDIAGDTPLYLDCHDGNVAFYQKMGFVQKRFALVPKGIPDETPYFYNGMVKGL